MAVGIPNRLIGMVQDQVKGSLLGDEDLTDYPHGHRHLLIITEMESLFWTPEIETGRRVTEGRAADLAAQPVEAISIPTSRATSESEWTDMRETVVETTEHVVDHQSPDRESGIITGIEDRLTVGLAHLDVMELMKGTRLWMSKIQTV